MFKLALFILLSKSVFSNPEPRVYTSKIVGGKYVKLRGMCPYQAEIIQKEGHRDHICGGALVHAEYVLTAAHCFPYPDSENPKNFEVRIGNIYRDKGGEVYQIKKIIKHPKFNLREEFDYDAALLKLSTPVTFSDNIQSIKVSKLVPEEGTPGIITGWGTESNLDDKFSPVLKYATVSIWNKNDCKQKLEKTENEVAYNKRRRVITDSMFCAGYKPGGVDACLGDSGGPFVINGKLVGIISWGDDCGEEDLPGVFTDVSKIVDWACSVIRNC